MREKPLALLGTKLKLMKINLVILTAFLMGCASQDAVESARKEVEPIEEPKPEGLPENYQTVYIPDNTL